MIVDNDRVKIVIIIHQPISKFIYIILINTGPITSSCHREVVTKRDFVDAILCWESKKVLPINMFLFYSKVLLT